MKNGKLVERKRSSDSEKSLSSLSNVLSDSKSQTKDVLELQKKMKVLRDAIIKERQEKESLIKQKNETAVEMDKLRAQLQEKDVYSLKLRNENSDLHNKLQIQLKKVENLTNQAQSSDGSSVGGMIGSIFGGGGKKDEYQKLLTEHNYLKKQLETVLEKLNRSDTSIEQLKRENRKQVEGLQKKIADLEKELEDKVQAYIGLSHKNQDLMGKYEVLTKEKIRVEDELRRTRDELGVVNHEKDELEKDNGEKLKTMNEMNEVCQKMEKEIESLTEKNSKLAAELEDTELKLQIFDLKKVGIAANTPAQILLRKNVAGEQIIEVENAGERLVIYSQYVQSFGPYKETEDKFYIEYKGSDGRVVKDTFMSDNRKKVLKHLMAMVKSSQENKSSGNPKKSAVVEKNIFSQVVSFFGN